MQSGGMNEFYACVCGELFRLMNETLKVRGDDKNISLLPALTHTQEQKTCGNVAINACAR